MINNRIAFISFNERDNLGIGYMAALLEEKGFDVSFIDLRRETEEIIVSLREFDPLVTGISVIYQYHISRYAGLVTAMRETGIGCHVTAGGHYASLRFTELYSLIPQLDSIVRFEGEYTMLELAECLRSGSEWKKVKGLAYRTEHEIRSNSLRPLEKNLDKFPFPLRLPPGDYLFGKKSATIIAGRGCINRCAYCNARKFYTIPAGPVKRVRTPENVADEMEYLYREKGCSVFLFQDDDFPVKFSADREWTQRFCNNLVKKGLKDKVIWKICCRPDEIDEPLFSLMRDHGLFYLFMGIEDGTDEGLARLNKNMTVSESQAGIDLLKRLGLAFDYGFMLFQPYTTFETLQMNLEFLRKICGDGYAPVSFLKMMPYYETRIEKELIETGRIKGGHGCYDYDFAEMQMNHYFSFVNSRFSEWLRDREGVANLAKWTRISYQVASRFFGEDEYLKNFLYESSGLVAESNKFILDTMSEIAVLFRKRAPGETGASSLETISAEIDSKHQYFKHRLGEILSHISEKYQEQIIDYRLIYSMISQR